MRRHDVVGTASAPLREADLVRRLVQRVGLGPRPGELAAARSAGFAATLDRLTRPTGTDPGVGATPPPVLQPVYPLVDVPLPVPNPLVPVYIGQGTAEFVALASWWVNRMVAVTQPFVERMAWFWHGHFATNIEKVAWATLMYQQNEVFRKYGTGDFRNVAQAIVRDPAMLIWLDAHGSRLPHPNENLAREFMELFTLGVGNYTETDVRQAARALTGYSYQFIDGTFDFNPADHDPGKQTVLGRTANFDATALVDQLLAQPASPRFIAGRVWKRFVSSDTEPDPATLQRMVAAYGPGRDMSAMLRAAATSPAFADSASILVTEPLLWLVAAMRALDLTPARQGPPSLPAYLAGLLSQAPFDPPNVGGWRSGASWLTTSLAYYRFEAASELAKRADLSALTTTAPRNRVAATAELLGCSGFTDRTAAALGRATDQPPLLVALALASPEYCISS